MMKESAKRNWASSLGPYNGIFYWKDDDGWHNAVMSQGNTKMAMTMKPGETVKNMAKHFCASNPITYFVISGIFQDNSGPNTPIMGDIIINKTRVIHYTPTPSRAYLAFDAGNLYRGPYSMGLGAPPVSADAAFSGVCPLILGGKKFDSGNSFYNGLNQRTPDTGKAIVALCGEPYIIYVAVQPDGLKKGLKVDAVRDNLEKLGFEDGVLLEGSDSVMMYRNSQFLTEPGFFKNQVGKTAIAFSR